MSSEENLMEGIEINQEGQEMDMTENNKDQTLMSWSEEQEMDLPEEQMEEATYRDKVVGSSSKKQEFLLKNGFCLPLETSTQRRSPFDR